MWPNHGTLLNNRTNSPKILLNNLHIKWDKWACSPNISQFFGQHLGIPTDTNFLLANQRFTNWNTKRHILICCGQMRSTSSELWRSSKQAPPSPWVRPTRCHGWKKPAELDMNWIWCSETETGFRVLAHVAKFGTDSHILFHDFHATSCHKTLQAVVSLWANWAKWIRVAELGDNAQRWGINANPIQCHQVLMLYLAGPLEPKPETCERFWGGTTRLVTGRVSLSVPNRIIHRIDTDSDPMYVCYVALSIYIYTYDDVWWYSDIHHKIISEFPEFFVFSWKGHGLPISHLSTPAWELSFLWQRPTARLFGRHFGQWSFWWPPPAEDEHCWGYSLQTGA